MNLRLVFRRVRGRIPALGPARIDKTDPVLATHAATPVDDEPLSDDERDAIEAWHRSPGGAISAEEAKRRLLADDEMERTVFA